ncbi:MAG: CoA-binding protein [Peptococcaceae bacterium]|nr:CoA-binding protein [Peptococcaceae bacterium]
MTTKDFFPLKNWVVVGDVLNESKFAAKIRGKLTENGYQVTGVHPKGGEGIVTKLAEVAYRIDVIDLCISPVTGLDYLKEAAGLGIDKVLIQPGAGSKEILDFCLEKGIHAVEGCALVMLSGAG